MEKVITATQARVHFGEVLRDVSEHDQIVIVERNGRPTVAIISIERLERLRQRNQDGVSSSDWFDRAVRTRENIRRALDGRPLSDVTEIIHEMREERDRQILHNMRPDLLDDPENS